LQSVQWAAIYAGSILTGKLGGILSEYQEQRLGFLICGGLMSATFALSLLIVREPQTRAPSEDWRKAIRSLVQAARAPEVLAVGAFIFLWHFNPCCQAVLYIHMTDCMGFSEEFYGDTMSLIAVGSLLACVTYGFYCRFVPMRKLVYAAVLLGVASTWGYWCLADRTSAVVVSLLTGFAYMTASMILVDLAARACPLQAAGTLFALFMATCNTSSAITTWLGGTVYEAAGNHWGYEEAFGVVVALGGLFCASSWWAIRFLPSSVLGRPMQTSAEPELSLLPELPVLAELPLAIEPPQRRI
jgi:predicted MFS family arabinose efflux permease